MVEGARLESVYTGNRIAGSNPAPSASLSSLNPSPALDLSRATCARGFSGLRAALLLTSLQRRFDGLFWLILPGFSQVSFFVVRKSLPAR